jgi:hypothetical protein
MTHNCARRSLFLSEQLLFDFFFYENRHEDIMNLKLHFFFTWRHSIIRGYAVPLLKFLDNTRIDTQTYGRTPLNE